MSRIPVPGEADHEQLAGRVAQALTRYGLRQPAILLLETGRPLTFLAGQLFYVAQPALSLFWSYERLTRIGQFLENPEAVPQLLAHLEAE